MNSYRDTWAEIDLDAVAGNTAYFKTIIPPSCRLMAVVKADAYGHGATEVAGAAIQAGADYLGVAFVDEALQLREAGIAHPILILGYTPPHSVEAAIRNHVALTVFSDAVLEEIMAASDRLRCRAVIHMKTDTGLGRLGLGSEEEIVALIRKAQQSPLVEVEGIFTHFADADSFDDSYTRLQFERFASIVRRLEYDNIAIHLKHCCNTSAALLYPQFHLSMVRIGIGLYGLQPADRERQLQYRWPLRQAMHLKTTISSLKKIGAHQPVSYGCTFREERETLVAVLPIGYADGYPRLLSNRGEVVIRSKRVPVIGRVCMDQTMVDVTSLPEVSVGDEVVIIGGDGDTCIPAGEIADWAQTIHYEIVCGVGKRVPRHYTTLGTRISVSNHLLGVTSYRERGETFGYRSKAGQLL